MKISTTLLLLIALAGLGVYLFVTRNAVPPAEPTDQSQTPSDTKLLDLSPSDVTHVAIAPADGQRIVLNRSGDAWTLVEPTVAPADPAAVNDLISALADLRSTGQLSASQKSAGGLDQPTYTVELTGQGGKVITIAFGSRPLVGGALDVLVSGRDRPDVVSSGIYDQLQHPASIYRKMALVSVPAEKIDQVSIVRPDSPTVHLQKTGDQWTVYTASQPTTAPSPRDKRGDKAAASAAQDLTLALSGLTAKSFVDQNRPLDFFGLDHPTLEVWFNSAQEAAGHGQTILFGRPVDVTKADVYASIGGEIVTVPMLTETTLEKSAPELRDKALLDVDPETVTSLSIHVDRTPEAQVLGPNQAPRYDFTLERTEEQHIAGPALPATSPGTAASRPASPMESHWDLFSGMRVAKASDAPVIALLQAFHPLTVQKYVDLPATTQPASSYKITIKTNSNRTEVITFTDPGGDKPLIGSYGDATFELDRAMLAKINTRF